MSSHLAERIASHLAENPHENAIGDIATKLEADPDDVATVLDRYAIEDGVVVHVGAGQGHGWIPEEIAEQYRERRTESVFLGYRWPDGELRDEIFDIKDENHLAVLGLTLASNDGE